jgi:hypothetical protein
MAPIFVVDGAPACGKSTLCTALMKRFESGLHIEVDRLREWVVSGIAHPMNWNEETVRQFRLAEHSAVDLAIRYQDAGFAVAIDHCRRLENWDEVLVPRLAGRPVVKSLVTCRLETNLQRNKTRTNKDFESSELVEIIRDLSLRLPKSQKALEDWHLIDNEQEGIEMAVEALWNLGQTALQAARRPGP